MATFSRKRSHLILPIWTTVLLATVNIAVMVVLIVQLAQNSLWLGLVLGSLALGISLFGISFYSFLPRLMWDWAQCPPPPLPITNPLLK